MSRPSLDNQGRTADVPAPKWNWSFIGTLACAWLFVGLFVAGLWFGGRWFAAGAVLVGVGEFALLAWAFQWGTA